MSISWVLFRSEDSNGSETLSAPDSKEREPNLL